MRVGIITITDYENYGNKLQNYALQTVLEKMGLEAVTIPCRTLKKYKYYKIYPIVRLISGIAGRNRQRIGIALKQIKFNRFTKKYIKTSNEFATLYSIPETLNSSYDYFVAGSDQIWNPYTRFNWDFNFLSFADCKKRISYAASIGVSSFSDSVARKIKERIENIRFLSVREKSAAEIIMKMTGRDADVSLDPTLLLDKEEWVKRFHISPKNKNDSYILSYYLGTKESKNIAIGKALEYVDLPVYDLSSPENVTEYCHDPREFVCLIQNAGLVVTDSFHGVVFSILMEVPFFYTERVDENAHMGSRVKSLFKVLCLENREGLHTEHICSGVVRASLKKEREQSLAYLMSALGVNDASSTVF